MTAAIDIIQYKKVFGNTDYPTRDSNLIDALQPIAAAPQWPFSYDPATTSGLTLAYYGGQMVVDGVLTAISDGTVVLTDAATNYVEATRAGVLSANTSAFTAGRIPLYTAVTAGGAITALTDVRGFNQPHFGRLALATTGGTTTLTYLQARVNAIDVTGVLVSNATIEVPAVPWQWTINNGTSGAFSLTVKVNGQTGVTIPQGERRVCVCDATDVRALTGYVATDGDTMNGSLTLATGNLTLSTGNLVMTAGSITLAADPVSAMQPATKQYTDGLVVGLLDDRGNHDASGNTWPSSGGSGTAGAILKGDVWRISVAGTLGGEAVAVGDTIRALVDTPGSTASNWGILQANAVAASTTTSGLVELATTAETQTGTDTDRAVVPAALAATAVYQGKHSFNLPAYGMKPRETGGCAPLTTTAGAANQPDIDYLAFDGTTAEYARAVVQMPLDYDGGTISAKFSHRRASGTGAANVIWGLRAVAVGDDGSPATNFGTGATVTDACSTTTANFMLSGETGACTIANTPAAGKLVFIEVYRDAGAGGDTLDAVDAWLSMVTIFYTTNAKNEA